MEEPPGGGAPDLLTLTLEDEHPAGFIRYGQSPTEVVDREGSRLTRQGSLPDRDEVECEETDLTAFPRDGDESPIVGHRDADGRHRRSLTHFDSP